MTTRVSDLRLTRSTNPVVGGKTEPPCLLNNNERNFNFEPSDYGLPWSKPMMAMDYARSILHGSENSWRLDGPMDQLVSSYRSPRWYEPEGSSQMVSWDYVPAMESRQAVVEVLQLLQMEAGFNRILFAIDGRVHSVDLDLVPIAQTPEGSIESEFISTYFPGNRWWVPTFDTRVRAVSTAVNRGNAPERVLLERPSPYEERIQILRGYAAEEGISVREESVRDFGWFVKDLVPSHNAQLIILDNGNLRAVWKQDAKHLGLQFLGDRQGQYVVFKPGGSEGEITRFSGKASLDRMSKLIEEWGLQSLVSA